MSSQRSGLVNFVMAQREAIDKKLGGLTDAHLKFLFYFIKHEMRIPNFRIEIKHNKRPKSVIVHCYSTEDPDKEIFIEPKPDFIKTMREYINLPSWHVSFAKRNNRALRKGASKGQ